MYFNLLFFYFQVCVNYGCPLILWLVFIEKITLIKHLSGRDLLCPVLGQFYQPFVQSADPWEFE